MRRENASLDLPIDSAIFSLVTPARFACVLTAMEMASLINSNALPPNVYVVIANTYDTQIHISVKRICGQCYVTVPWFMPQVSYVKRICGILGSMTRKHQFPGTSSVSKVTADYINQLASKEGVSQADLGKVLKRSQSYVQTRCAGLQSWSVDDVDALAKFFGFPNGFALLDKARGM